MRMSLTLRWIFAFLIFSSSLVAQQDTCCVYRLQLNADFGFGWNGSFLRVHINDESTDYTLTVENSNGSFLEELIPVFQGDDIRLEYFSMAGDFDLYYSLLDASGNLLFSDGPGPQLGEVYDTSVTCPDCIDELPDSYISIEDIRAMHTDLYLEDCNFNGSYIVQYDTTGFQLDSTMNVINSDGGTVTLTGLQEQTNYQFYVAFVCPTGDTTNFVGPINFETILKVDVGIVDISSPISGCGLTADETVAVTLRNFGANPQSLIPFTYSVNGVEAGVSQPFDGYFTGVLGKDSTFVIEFETTYDFSEPGDYEIAAWTEVEQDSDRNNDTTYVTITVPTTVAEFPYFEDFEESDGGWAVAAYSFNSSWAYDTLNGEMINTPPSGGQLGWGTNPSGDYNANEDAYWLSPCFNLNGLEHDPILSLSMFVDTELNFDEGWLEITTDGGETWELLGTGESGENWYNNTFNDYWEGNGGVDGWRTVSHVLTNSAGTDARLRFVFSSDGSVQNEGFGIDEIAIVPALTNDLSAVNARHSSEEECGAEEDFITVVLTNWGTATQSGFNVVYQVNDELPIIENVDTLSLDRSDEVTYTFATPFNSTGLGTFTINVWTELEGEENVSNDTTSFTFFTAMEAPFYEDFEEGMLPPNWTSTQVFAPVIMAHNSESFVVYSNLYSFNPFFEVTTPVFGPIEEGDSLLFDYRYVDFSGGGINATTLSDDDEMIVAFSTDCGQTYEDVLTINGTNHTPSNVMQTLTIYLDDYVGQAIKVRFSANWATGDYYLDLDNINIGRCSGSLDLSAQVLDATLPDSTNGVITVFPGSGLDPFTYTWAHGAEGQALTDLMPGTYVVTVTDVIGCTDSLEVTLNLDVAVEDIEELNEMLLIPNPTDEKTTLQLTLTQPTDVEIRLTNMMGQLLFVQDLKRVSEASIDLDLNSYPSGIYFVSVWAEDKVRTQKLVKR